MGVILKARIVRWNRMVSPTGIPGPVGLKLEVDVDALAPDSYQALQALVRSDAHPRVSLVLLPPENTEP